MGNKKAISFGRPVSAKALAFKGQSRKNLTLPGKSGHCDRKKMRILFYHQYFKTPLLHGGTRSYEMSKAFIERGHEVTVVCSYDPGLCLKKTGGKRYAGNIEGINIVAYDVPYSNKMGLYRRSLAFAEFSMRSLPEVCRQKYDLLFASSTPISIALAGIFSKIVKPRKKFVFEVCDLWPDVPIALGVRNPLFTVPMRIFEWCAYNFSDACIGLSSDMVDGIRRRSSKNKPVVLIPNFADTETFKPSSEKGVDLDGIEPGDFTAIFTGAHGIANGLDSVLDMAKVLKDRGIKTIKIALIGDGKMKPELVKRAARDGLDNVKFYDPMQKSKLARILERADAGLMVLKDVPAFYYGTSPNKYFDYLSCGIPIVTNIRGWISDDIIRNKCGLSVPPNNPGAFADALQTLEKSKETRTNMGIAARKLAEEKYSKKNLTRKMTDFLESIVANPRQ